MLKIFNATRHRQHDFEDEWKKYGVTFVPTLGPQISSIHPRSSAESLDQEAEDAIEKAVYSGADGVLIGGISGLAILIAVKARLENLIVIEPMSNGRLNNAKSLTGYRDLSSAIDCNMRKQLLQIIKESSEA